MTPQYRITKVASNLCGKPMKVITPDSSLKELGFDSLDMIEFILELEVEFDMDIEADSFDTIKDAIYFIGDKLEELQ